MKIGIDIQTTLGEKTGFGFYVENLINNLKKIDTKNNYSFFKPDTSTDLSAPQRLIWDQLKIPQKAKIAKVDILHQPCFSAPIFYRGKVIVTIHDIIAILYGKDIPFYSRMFFSKIMPYSYHRADKIITISEHTKNDIIKYLKIPQDKIKVIYSAAGDEFFSQPVGGLSVLNHKIEAVKKKYKISGKYLIHIGTLNPRKNLSFLIKVFSQVIKQFPDYQLVITGKKGWYYQGLFDSVKELGLESKVIFTGYIEDKEKPLLYKGATIFVFPSLYEGFGLPPLEAMASGCPVISSNTSSLPEILGSAGILLSPSDELAWVRSIKSVLSDKKIQNNLSKQGILQAKKFSWEKTARETLEVYEEVYNK